MYQRKKHYGPLVLIINSLNLYRLNEVETKLTHVAFNPATCHFKTGEQPDPLKLLHLKDMTSRHRGREPSY